MCKSIKGDCKREKLTNKNRRVTIFYVLISILSGMALTFLGYGNVWFSFIMMILFLIILIIFVLKEVELQNKEETTKFRCKYVGGALDFFIDSLCVLDLLDDTLEISDSGSIFKIQYQKIINIYFNTNENEERIYTSKGGSCSKTFIGGVLFGEMGAMAGAAKSNQINSHIEKTYKNYIVIRYISKTGKKYIIYLSLDDSKRKFKNRLKYIIENYIQNNEQSIIEEL